MLASTSGVRGAASPQHDPFIFIKKQMIWIALSAIAAWVCSCIPYRTWKHLAIPVTLVTIVLLVLVLIPSIGTKVGGSRRWLRLGPIGFQPSELAKISVIMLLAWYMASIQRRPDEFKRGILIPSVGLAAILVLILAEPDYGTTLLIAAVGALMMFIGGTRISFLVIFGTLGFTGFTFLILQNPERLRRIVAFRDPLEYKLGEAYQLINALYAFVLGGEWGVGLGNSIQKRFYLPEAHTDFIYAIIGEELGLPGSILVVLLFGLLFILGWIISRNAPDTHGKLLGYGITLTITLQACINMMVVTGLLPTKGLALPFISFGGSSFLVNGIMIGILVSIGLDEARETA